MYNCTYLLFWGGERYIKIVLIHTLEIASDFLTIGYLLQNSLAIIILKFIEKNYCSLIGSRVHHHSKYMAAWLLPSKLSQIKVTRRKAPRSYQSI